jgi:uncharacterized delta-60 repeat protein
MPTMTLEIEATVVGAVRAPAQPAAPFLATRRGASLAVAFALLAAAVGSDFATAAPGDLDPAFGGTGSIVEPVGVGATGLVLQPDGKPVVIGEGVVAGSSPPVHRFALARYAIDGSPDPTFGVSGIVGSAPIRARVLARRDDGRLIGAGITIPGGGQIAFAISLVQWHANGAVDATFGTSGVATSRGVWPLDFLPGPSVSAVVVEPNGKITVAGGAAHLGVRHLLLARFNPEGTVDASFGTAGVVSLPVDGTVHALVAEPDGKLVVAGETADVPLAAGSCVTLWRFAVDGSVDHDFGLDGSVRSCAGAPSGADALLQQPDGKLVAAGFGTDEGTGRRFAQITRFGTDGSIDVAFGSSGSVRVSDRSSDLEARAVAIQPDGRLVIAGSRFMSARFDPDGFVNLGYGVNGVVHSAIPTGDARQLAIQPDGRIVAAGATVDDVRHPAMAVTRLLGVAEAVPGAGRVIEYVNTGNFPAEPGGHFFYTLDGSAESRLVDSGTAGAFQRTGQSWNAGGTSAVARFYGSMQPGPNSHFYTVSPVESDDLLAMQVVPAPATAQQWNHEGLAFAATPAVVNDDATRSCPLGRIAVYRAYNNAWGNGVRNPWDSNHRYSTDPATIEAMVRSYGWSDDGIAWCALAS